MTRRANSVRVSPARFSSFNHRHSCLIWQSFPPDPRERGAACQYAAAGPSATVAVDFTVTATSVDARRSTRQPLGMPSGCRRLACRGQKLAAGRLEMGLKEPSGRAPMRMSSSAHMPELPIARGLQASQVAASCRRSGSGEIASATTWSCAEFLRGCIEGRAIVSMQLNQFPSLLGLRRTTSEELARGSDRVPAWIKSEHIQRVAIHLNLDAIDPRFPVNPIQRSQAGSTIPSRDGFPAGRPTRPAQARSGSGAPSGPRRSQRRSQEFLAVKLPSEISHGEHKRWSRASELGHWRPATRHPWSLCGQGDLQPSSDRRRGWTQV